VNRHDRRAAKASGEDPQAALEAMYEAAYESAAALAGHDAGLAAVRELKRLVDAGLIAEIVARMPSIARN
jgi:hypothetical protein